MSKRQTRVVRRGGRRSFPEEFKREAVQMLCNRSARPCLQSRVSCEAYAAVCEAEHGTIGE